MSGPHLDARHTANDARAMDDEALDPREAERIRRRDHEAGAADRELLRPGMGKVFKQILDRQGRVAREQPAERPAGPRRKGR
jgi:hypothetical protein